MYMVLHIHTEKTVMVATITLSMVRKAIDMNSS